jgi:mannan endo-1,4-beta-mannosidase
MYGGASAGIANDPDLVIHYTFDDFTTVVPDQSGKGHDGTVQGDVTPFADMNHRAGKFAGKKGAAGFSYLDLDGANIPAGDIPTSAITLSAWVKCDNSGDHHAIFNARAADATWVVHPELRSDATFRWLLRAAGSVVLFDLRAPGVVWGEWLHYLGTYDKATGKAILYINGQVAAQQTVTPAKDIASDWASGARVGINVDNARQFTGLMDELYVLKRAVLQSEWKEISQIVPQLKAYAPEPPDGAKNVIAPLLRWSAGDKAVLHKVYLGTRAELGPADLVSGPAPTTVYWQPGGFTPGVTYFWRVDEIEADGVTAHAGDVWSFTAAILAASNPSPYDGERWAGINTDLTWTAGADTLSHDVYFSIDKAAVEARDPSAFKGNQPGAAYTPGTLAKDTTYYWRVDEHAPDNVLREGPVWSFTTLGPEAGVRAQYFRNTWVTGTPVSTQIEESIDHNWGEGAVAAGITDTVSALWTADLEVPFTGPYQLITTSDDGVRLWLDGRLIISDWRSHGSTDDLVMVDLIAGQPYLLQMEWYENSGSVIARLWWQSDQIRREIVPAGPLQLPVRAVCPYPANTAMNASQTLRLRWTAGEAAISHDVYFGEDANAVAAATSADTSVCKGNFPDANPASKTFDPGVLVWNKTYYWRVDEVNQANANSPWKGSLWSFTTADFIVVDDFESYTDDIDNRIFQTWIDCYAYDSPGGGNCCLIVGYMDAPFCEQKVVHTGLQSMPLDYNNVDAPYYGETTRTWDTAQNWMINGMDTLVLYFRAGKVSLVSPNPQPLYVAVQDSTNHVAVVNHPDADAVAKVEWQEWKIPLADFAAAGVNVTKVKKMYIGIGDRANPKPGGAGLLFIDDVRVIKAPAK